MNHTRRLLNQRYAWASSPTHFADKFQFTKTARTHLIFGANTDVGKTVITAGLVQASLRDTSNSTIATRTVNYIKPLQCGGSDASFIERHCVGHNNNTRLVHRTLFSWETPASPHVASRNENLPRSDDEVLSALQSTLREIADSKESSTTWIETAGGVLSPSSASPDNNSPQHASSSSLVSSDDDNSKSNSNKWGWLTQGSLYQPLATLTPVVLCGDGRLGGISATLSSLESLIIRGYNVVGIVMLETGYDNVSAIREYAGRSVKLQSSSGIVLFEDPQQSIVSLPQLPPEPEPLHDWYHSAEVVETLDGFHAFLSDR